MSRTVADHEHLTRARNVATVEAMYESERQRDLAAWSGLWHPEGRQTFPFAPASTVVGLDQLRETTRVKFESRPPYEIEVRTEPFADPSRVLARLHLVMPEERSVEIWCIFHLDDGGRILEVEEMLDRSGAPAFPG